MKIPKGCFALAGVVALTVAASGASAQKAGGVLKIQHMDTPPSASIHEEATVSVAVPFTAQVLMCPEELAAELPVMFDHVLIAWDHSAPAARAVADALPMLQSAKTVHIITATDKRMSHEMESGTALVDHLAEHGINAVFEAVKIDGSSIGKVFEAYVKKHAIALLVMGAYRHTRLNEIVWGGATKTVIGQPPCWVMMSR